MTGDEVADPGLDELRRALASKLEVLRRLGAGGMGAVYLARDPTLNRLVAIKVLGGDLANDAVARARFAREAESTAALEHPNIVGVFQVGALPESGAPYLVMQYVDGKTLGELFPHDSPAPNPVARRIVGEVAAALAAAHASGLIHRDIKPSNVIVESRTGRAIVVDFGISSILERPTASPTVSPKLTATGMYVGTPMYMSPEVASGEPASPSTDIYSLGVLGYEIIAGRPPFEGTSAMALLAAHLKDAPPSLMDHRADVDPELARLVDACLAKDAASRPTAAEIARFLLPSHQQLEWPPPGLETLRGAGARLTSAIGGCALLLWLLFSAALLQSTRTMSCCWRELEGNSLFGGIRTLLDLPLHVDEIILVTIYGSVLVVGVLSLPVMWWVTLKRAWLAGGELRRARAASYPWSVALSVAWDRRTDTAALRSGADLFAVAAEPERARFLRLRELEAALLLSAAIVALIMPIGWAFGVFSFGQPDGALLPQREFLALLAPVLALLVAAAASRHSEQRFRDRARAKRSRASSAPAAVRPELVARWLDQAGLAVNRPRFLPPRWAMATLAWLLITPAAVVIAFSIGVVLYVSTSIPAMRQTAAVMTRDTLRAEWTFIRATLDSLARVPRWDDERAGLVPGAFMTASQRAQPYLKLDAALLAQYPPDSVPAPREYASGDSKLWSAVRTEIPAGTLAQLRADTMAPGLRYWRAFAHSPKPEFLWLVRGTSSSAPLTRESTWKVGVPSGKLFEMGARNMSGALLALHRGDTAEALMRARENVAASWYLAQGTPWTWMYRPLYDLSRVAVAVGDTALVRTSQRVLARWRELYGDMRPWTLFFVDIGDTVGVAAVLDPGINPMERMQGLQASFFGFCYNAREILFGIDPRRRELIESIGARLPASAALVVAEALRDFDAWAADPWTASGGSQRRRMSMRRIPSWFGLGDAVSRLAACN